MSEQNFSNTATNTFRLGSIFGVRIAVHFTWFVIFALITFSMTGTFALQCDYSRFGEEEMR